MAPACTARLGLSKMQPVSAVDDSAAARGPAEPDAAELDAALSDLAERFRNALAPSDDVAVAIDAETLRLRLDEPLPEHGLPLSDVLPGLAERVTPGLAATTGGRYLGYVTGGLLPAAAIAQAWVVAVDQNTGLWALAPAAVELEQLAL